MKSFLIKKPVILILAVLVLAAFTAFLFHTHADGQHLKDCAICKLTQQLVALFVLACALFSENPVRKSFSDFLSGFTPLLLASRLQARAPPLLS